MLGNIAFRAFHAPGGQGVSPIMFYTWLVVVGALLAVANAAGIVWVIWLIMTSKR